jgi:hypothetical protein
MCTYYCLATVSLLGLQSLALAGLERSEMLNCSPQPRDPGFQVRTFMSHSFIVPGSHEILKEDG